MSGENGICLSKDIGIYMRSSEARKMIWPDSEMMKGR
jgi:hypothetical protein